jgi:K+/H+ antiporter YhaU regulatory subunit KhtT
MIAIASLLLTLTLSLLVTRVASMALMLTGLSTEMARFQARSAFSGVGFTTSEAESIVNHPIRRRIVMILMLLGNLGIATVVATTLASVIHLQTTEQTWLVLTVLVTGLATLWMLASSRWVERHLNKAISFALRRLARLEVRDYVAVLHLQNEYAVTELHVEPHDWLADNTLAELRLESEGVLVLGIQRPNGDYIGAPGADTPVRAGDVLVLYAPLRRVQELDQRRKGHHGETAHREAVEEHEEVLEEQEKLEEEAEQAAGAETPRPGQSDRQETKDHAE